MSDKKSADYGESDLEAKAMEKAASAQEEATEESTPQEPAVSDGAPPIRPTATVDQDRESNP